VHDVAGSSKERHALDVGVPAEVVDVEVCEEDDVDVVRRHIGGVERRGEQTLELG
jgi:hypothetical protein